MSRTQALRRQHDALSELSEDLLWAMKTIETEYEAAHCSQILAKMTGILTIHLASEDQSLYPRLMASSDPTSAQVARDFAEEMGGLAQTYQAFETNWRTGMAILADPDRFRQEAKTVLRALALRIKRENSVLYPLADRLDADRLDDGAEIAAA